MTSNKVSNIIIVFSFILSLVGKALDREWDLFSSGYIVSHRSQTALEDIEVAA